MTNADVSLFTLVDYAGVANTWLEDESGGSISLGTEVSGSITERLLEDGRAHVTMRIHTSNALIFVTNIETEFPGPLVFGNFAVDVKEGAPASVAETFFNIEFINTAPGAPIPDLTQLINFPEEGQEVIFTQFIADSDGLLADGTRGRVQVVQIGAVGRGALVGSPADKILVQSVGRR